MITNAMDAKMKNGMAILEEFLQEKYVELYDDIKDDDNKVLALINNSSTSKYFYKPDVGALQYIVDSEGHALYLINKDNLPKEVKQSLVGGEAGDKKYSDYASLIDVYGVTTDLKVYYCSNGIDSLYGLSKENLDNDNPLREVFSNSETSTSTGMYNLVSDYDKDNDGVVTAEELKVLKKLTIDESSSVENLKELYNLPSLQELTIKSKKLNNLDGIQNCIQLYYIYFDSVNISDYSQLKGVSRTLQYLYCYNIDDNEFNRLCVGMKNEDFSILNYFAVVGHNGYISDVRQGDFGSTKSDNTITTLAPLDNLSLNTKKAIKYMNIQNNNISDTTDGENVTKYCLEYLRDFTEIELLRCEYNNITKLDGLENMSKLSFLCAVKNKLGIYDGEEYNTSNSLNKISNLENLKTLNLKNNNNLVWVNDLGTLDLEYLNLDGCEEINDESIVVIKKFIKSLGLNCKYPTKYWLSLLDDNTTDLSLENQTITRRSVRRTWNKYKFGKIKFKKFKNN